MRPRGHATDGGFSGCRHRMELPFSAKWWALLTSRSTIASASVESPAVSAVCQFSTGSWLTTTVERTRLLSSITSSKSLASIMLGLVKMKSSKTTPILARDVSRRTQRPSPRLSASSVSRRGVRTSSAGTRVGRPHGSTHKPERLPRARRAGEQQVVLGGLPTRPGPGSDDRLVEPSLYRLITDQWGRGISNQTAAESLLATAEVGPLDRLGRARVERSRAQIAFDLRRGSDAPPLLTRAVASQATPAARARDPFDRRVRRRGADVEEDTACLSCRGVAIGLVVSLVQHRGDGVVGRPGVARACFRSGRTRPRDGDAEPASVRTGLPHRVPHPGRRVAGGGWTLEAAEAVSEAPDTLARLTRLVDQSLVLAEQDDSGAVRYRVLEPLREFGIQRLEAAGRAVAMRDRHAAYFFQLTESAQDQLWEPYIRGSKFPLLERDIDNLRSALRWLIERSDNERAARLVSGYSAAGWPRAGPGFGSC